MNVFSILVTHYMTLRRRSFLKQSSTFCLDVTLTNYIRISVVRVQVCVSIFKVPGARMEATTLVKVSPTQHRMCHFCCCSMPVCMLKHIQACMLYVVQDNMLFLPFAWLFGTFGLDCYQLAQKYSTCHGQFCIQIRIRRMIKETNENFNGGDGEKSQM